MRFRSTVEHVPRAGSTRSGQKRSCPGRGGPLAAARRLGSLLKMECTFAHFPLDVHKTWSMKVMNFRPKFLLLYRTLLDALIPDLPVSHAEAVGVARFCSPNLVGFMFFFLTS